MLICGIALISYPTISNIINNYTNYSFINRYNKSVQSLSKQQKKDYLVKAYEYNQMVRTEFYPATIQKKFFKISKSYNNIMNFGDGLIGYISIDKINVYLPIYHSTTPNALSRGAVHLINTSFPVGQSNCHTVISAHSGYPANKLFDDIDNLEIGDTFNLKIISDTYTYKIKKIDIVKPNDFSKLKVVEGKELVTLVTCYPYSINTHRLLVTAERIGRDKVYNNSKKSQQNKFSDLYPILVICIGIFFTYLLIFYIRKERGKLNND